MKLTLLCALALFVSVKAQPEEILGVEILEVQVFKEGIDNGDYDVLLDVRTKAEFDEEHIEGATLADSLGAYGTDAQVATPEDLRPCENCVFAVYCRSGRRASNAIRVLMENGFKGRFFNGVGMIPWKEAEYPLVSGEESVVPPCLTDASVQEQCRLNVLAYSGGGDEGTSGLAPTTDSEANGDEADVQDDAEESGVEPSGSYSGVMESSALGFWNVLQAFA